MSRNEPGEPITVIPWTPIRIAQVHPKQKFVLARLVPEAEFNDGPLCKPFASVRRLSSAHLSKLLSLAASIAVQP
jgi:hypothetical protein